MTVAIGVDTLDTDDTTDAAIGRMDAIARVSVELPRTGCTERMWGCCDAIGRMFAFRGAVCCSVPVSDALQLWVTDGEHSISYLYLSMAGVNVRRHMWAIHGQSQPVCFRLSANRFCTLFITVSWQIQNTYDTFRVLQSYFNMFYIFHVLLRHYEYMIDDKRW